ncbi:MAG: hypothetical protein R3D55_25135 [Chloroflexota bacterium]
MLYFTPVRIPQAALVGFAAVAVGVLANAGSAVLGRSINRTGHLRPLTVTTVSMGLAQCCCC